MAMNPSNDIDWPVITMTNNVTLIALQKKIYTAFKDMMNEHPCACDVSKGFWNSVYPQLTMSVWDMAPAKIGECRVPIAFSVIFRDDNNIEYASFNGPRCLGSIMFTRNGRDMFIHKSSEGRSIELAKFVLSRVRSEIEYQERKYNNRMKSIASDDLRRWAVDSRTSVLMTRNEYEVMLNSIDLKRKDLAIKDVIFNNPATIVYWKDGTKTVVKRQKGERWDKEKGLAMAIIKKAMDNKGNYNDIFRKWCSEDSQKKHTS